LSGSFLALNALYCLQKRTNFASSKILQLFFISNSVVFVSRGRKNIFCPRAQGTLAMPLVMYFQGVIFKQDCHQSLVYVIINKGCFADISSRIYQHQKILNKSKTNGIKQN